MNHFQVIRDTLAVHQKASGPITGLDLCTCGWQDDGKRSWLNHAAAEVEIAIKEWWAIVPQRQARMANLT